MEYDFESVSSREVGRVEDVKVIIGQKVARGDVLVVLDTSLIDKEIASIRLEENPKVAIPTPADAGNVTNMSLEPTDDDRCGTAGVPGGQKSQKSAPKTKKSGTKYFSRQL